MMLLTKENILMKIKVQKQDDGRLAIYVRKAGLLKIYGRDLWRKLIVYVPYGMTVAVEHQKDLGMSYVYIGDRAEVA